MVKHRFKKEININTLMGEVKKLLKLGGMGALIASLCCVTPIVLVLLGLAGVSTAAAFGNTLYWTYKWVFLGAAALFLVLSLVIYFRKQGHCTLDSVKRNRNKIINTTLLVFLGAGVMYMIFNYVFLELIGIQLGLWEIPDFLSFLR